MAPCYSKYGLICSNDAWTDSMFTVVLSLFVSETEVPHITSWCDKSLGISHETNHEIRTNLNLKHEQHEEDFWQLRRWKQTEEDKEEEEWVGGLQCELLKRFHLEELKKAASCLTCFIIYRWSKSRCAIILIFVTLRNKKQKLEIPTIMCHYGHFCH